MLAALATSWLFAFTAGCARKVACVFGSLAGNLIRLSLALLFTGLLVHLLGMGTPEARWFILSGVLGFGVGGGFMYLALPRLGSACAMLIVQTGFVLFGTLGEWLWLGQAPALEAVIPTVAILAGIVLSLAPRIHSGQIRGTRLQVATALLFALAAAAGQAAGALVARQAYLTLAGGDLSVHPLAATHLRLFGGWILAGLVLLTARACRIREPFPAGRQEFARSLPWVLANVLTGPVLGVMCYQVALSQAPVSLVAPIVALAPVWSEACARALGERPGRKVALLGTVLGVLGAIRLLTM